MKQTLVSFFLAITVGCNSYDTTLIKPQANLTDYQNTITEEGLFVDLDFLSSDSLKGRDTGSAGERIAADYLADRYQDLGLMPGGNEQTYYQNFELIQTTFDNITYEVLKEGESIDISVHSYDDIANFYRISDGEKYLFGDIVFVGLGVRDTSKINLENKWLLSFHDPIINSSERMKKLVHANNALGVIYIEHSNSEVFEEEAYIMQGEFRSESRVKLPHLNDSDKSYVRIHPKLASQLLGLHSINELNDLKNKLKANPNSFEPFEMEYSLKYTPNIRMRITKSRNVIAFIEGDDPILKDEVVVLSAHYDHVGVGSPDVNGDFIYNGADDDGSGTVALLQIAQGLKAAKDAGASFKRSVLFLHVSGEELGLLGSRFYSDHPVFPIEKTVANLNIDMIGRRDPAHLDNPNYIYIIGGKIISSSLQETLIKANKMSVNIELSDRYNSLRDPNQFYRRSDHWNFGRFGVPFIFFFNGTHKDYHKPSDEIDNIDFYALRKRTQLIFMTAALLSNSDEKPTVDNQSFILRTQQ
jgi:hypothetical protein